MKPTLRICADDLRGSCRQKEQKDSADDARLTRCGGEAIPKLIAHSHDGDFCSAGQYRWEHDPIQSTGRAPITTLL